MGWVGLLDFFLWGVVLLVFGSTVGGEEMRIVFVSGDVCSPTLALRSVRCSPHCKFWNTYGPTEVTVTSHGFIVECAADGTPNFGQSVPIGGAVGNTTGFILDGHNMPVPIGVAGELCLAAC